MDQFDASHRIRRKTDGLLESFSASRQPPSLEERARARQREINGGVMAGAAMGAAIGTVAAGPLGVMVGGTLGAVATS